MVKRFRSTFIFLIILLILIIVGVVNMDDQGIKIPSEDGILADEDFSDLPTGSFSRMRTPLYEYHFIPEEKYRGNWREATTFQASIERAYIPAPMGTWNVIEVDGHHEMEQSSVNRRGDTFPMIITGDVDWADYTLECELWPLSVKNMVGVMFRYQNSRNFYYLCFDNGDKIQLRRIEHELKFHAANWTILDSKDFKYNCDNYYHFKVEIFGSRIKAYVNNQPVFDLYDETFKSGKVGFMANVPVRYKYIKVYTTPEIKRSFLEKKRKGTEELNALREKYPKPKLWKKINTPNFGAGRALRFGDLNGDDKLDILIGQNIRRIPGEGDAYTMISCLTAIDLDGNILWQFGEPNKDHGLLTSDIAFQIYDIDQDGNSEVVLTKDFKILFLDGKTGKIKKSFPTPYSTQAAPAFYRMIGDCFYFANLSGRKRPQEIILKNRYTTFWVYNENLEFLWSGECVTGHFPYSYDIDDDGKDEIMMGYTMFDNDGKILWSLDNELNDHADGVFVGKLSDNLSAEPIIVISASDEGFLIVDKNGNIKKHVRIGHAQSPSIGNYRPDIAGLEICQINFWGNPGIITFFDCEGNILLSIEPLNYASPVLPVNWTGDGQEFVMISGNVKEGGLMDGWGRMVVKFPDDGHPDLCFNVMDITGDSRDEIVLWDQKSIWIYTQDKSTPFERIYKPVRNPHYNESNYRTNYSLPGWK